MARQLATADTFAVIADPTRRAILDLLREQEMTVSSLVSRFRVTQSAISQHLKLLRDAGLVGSRREGREINYRLIADPLAQVSIWVNQYEAFWHGKLETLGDLLDNMDD